MADEDLISQLGLQDSLHKKRLEEISKLDKVKEKSDQETFNKSFVALNKAREEFRKAYQKMCEHVPSKQEGSHSGCGSYFSGISNASNKGPEKIIDKKTIEFMTDEQRQKYKDQEKTKFLEAEFAKKKRDLEMAIERLGEEQEEDSKTLKEIATEPSKVDNYDLFASNKKLDRILGEIKSQSRTSDYLNQTKFNKIKD